MYLKQENDYFVLNKAGTLTLTLVFSNILKTRELKKVVTRRYLEKDGKN